MSEGTLALSDNTPEIHRPLSKRVLASYGAPALPLALVGLPMAVYLPAVYADTDGFGLALGAVGLILTLSRLTDVITDPLIGFFSDRLKTRWGRRKPFILIGTPIYALGIWLLFVPPIEFTTLSWWGFEFSSGYPVFVRHGDVGLPWLDYQGFALCRLGRRAFKQLQRTHAHHLLA